MAQGTIKKLSGTGHGFIHPTSATGATVVGQDLFFNAAQVVSLGDDETPLGVGDVVEYTYTAPVNRGVGIAPGTPVAVEIARIALGATLDARGQSGSAGTRATGGGQAAGPSVEKELRSNDRYRAI